MERASIVFCFLSEYAGFCKLLQAGRVDEGFSWVRVEGDNYS